MSGFTLIELMVAIAILSIFSGLLGTSYPAIRQSQQLDMAEQTIQSTLTDAIERSFNEIRDQGCLDLSNPDPGAGPLRKPKWCSDVGVKFERTQLIMFADADGSGGYSAADFLIKTVPIPPGAYLEVPAATAIAELFTANPPTVEMSPSSTDVEIKTGNFSRRIKIADLGKIERVP